MHEIQETKSSAYYQKNFAQMTLICWFAKDNELFITKLFQKLQSLCYVKFLEIICERPNQNKIMRLYTQLKMYG